MKLENCISELYERIERIESSLEKYDEDFDKWKINFEESLNKKVDDYINKEKLKNDQQRKYLTEHGQQVERFLQMIHAVIQERL